MAADIYLSPRKILEHLCLLEEKIPRKSNEPYVPTYATFCVDSEKRLNFEARQMLSHIGFGHYMPICEFTSLKEGTAGCVEMGGGSNYFVKIKIDEKYRDHSDAVLAILAHEICHKLIYYYGIDFPTMPIENEILTDLCTLYVGFGNLIIKGYNTTSYNYQDKVATTHILGYLEYQMYVDTYEIIRCVYGGYEPLKDVSVGCIDIFLQDALKQFANTENKRSLIIDKLKEKEFDLSSLNRDMLVLEQLLNICYTGNKEIIQHYNDIANNSGLFIQSDGMQNKIKVLKSLYDLDVEEKEMANIKFVLKHIEGNIISLWNHYAIMSNDINWGIVKCPNCGYMAQNINKDNEVSLIRCYKCHVIFAHNSTPISIAKWNKGLNDFIDEQDYLLQKGEEDMWNSMPIVLRWLTKKYLSRKKKKS